MFWKKGWLGIIAFALLVHPLLPSPASATPSPDFNGNGTVDIADFLEFVDVFGSSRGDGTYQAKYDLDSNGTIDIPDFLIFVDNFGKDVSPAKIYWAHADWKNASSGKIQRANLDGSQVEDLVTVGNPDGIALDLSAGKIYWVERSSLKIQRANLDGSQVEDLVTTGLVTPIEVALDLSAGKMYWVDHTTGKVQRANLDGSQVEDLVTGVRYIHGLALDVSAGKMYLGGMEGGKIIRANLDGSQVEDLVTGFGLHGIALDVSAGKMYWTWHGGTIQRANLDGSQVEDLVTGVSPLRGIALDVSAGKMYWTNADDGKISRANLDGSQVEDLVTGLESPRGIALDLARSTDSSGGSPDLIVESPSVNDNTLTTGQSFTLSATVRNSGTGSSVSTTLRYYRSSNFTISASDTQVGTDSVSGLSASGTSAESIILKAPSRAETYYYGACVESVSGESNTSNNCSTGVRVTVSSSGGGSEATTRMAFESATPAGYTSVTLKDSGTTVWGVPAQYTDDSDIGVVAYMLLAKLKGCSFANAEADRGSKVYIKTQSLGALPNFASETVCRTTSRSYGSWPGGVRITHLRFFDESSSTNIREAIYNASTGQYRDSSSGSGGDGGGGSPDLIVASLSVSDNTLTTGQSFTLSATVRNQGNGQSAATTLRYYLSTDATISTSDTQAGTDSVSGLPASSTSAESISLNAPSSAGTYYYGACVESVSGESNTNNNCSTSVRVTVSRSGSPDLIVESPSVSDNTLTTGQSFTLNATVRNQGNGQSAATTLRYYLSTDATISTSDTQVGTDSVSGLSASGTSAESISLNAPSGAGTYYYGVCVESVSGESNTNNNCSTSVRVTVSRSNGGGGGNTYGAGESLPNFPSGLFFPSRLNGANLSFSTGHAVISFNNGGVMVLQDGTTYTCIASGGCGVEAGRVTSGTISVTGSSGSGSSPDLIVESPSVSDNTLTTRQSFTLRATVRNSGTGSSASTTLRYYLSTDATISTSDKQVGTDSVNGLSASGTSAESISLNAPANAGTYYYGACVASVSGESDTNNNCSTGIRVTVSGSATITIADANLRAVIADSLDKSRNAPITRAEMATLTSIDARNKGIRSLTGLEHATNLQRLDLGSIRVNGESVNSNDISTLSPLSNLTNLTVLDLDTNSISSISALSNLTNLTWMSLGGNSISSISALSNLTKLTELYLWGNSISDISVLSNLTKLTELYLWGNSISDISVLSNLTKLTVLDLDTNSISDISPLVTNAGLGNGDTVNLKSNPLSNISINTHIPALQLRGVIVEFDAPTPTTPPPEPSNVTYQVESGLYQISWDPSPDATRYEVYYDGGGLFYNPSCPGGCERIATVERTTFSHSGREVKNEYWVRACNTAGCSDYVQALRE